MSLHFIHVDFGYAGTPASIFKDIQIHFPFGWTGVVGPNGCGKTTLLQLATGDLIPDAGTVDAQGTVIYCSQRMDSLPERCGDFMAATDREAFRMKGMLGIDGDWFERWSTLSHGERKRLQIGVALWHQPDILLVDEPTNHLDSATRQMVGNALRDHSGCGLLVSHDRDLLDTLCRQCLFVCPPGVVLRPGNYSAASEQAESERESRRHERKVAKQSLNHLTQTQNQRRHKAAQADKMRSKRGISDKDHDAKARINQARNTGRDGRSGALYSQLDGRMRQAAQRLEDTRAEKVYRSGIWMPGARARQDTLLSLPEGELRLGSERRLMYPSLSIGPTARIAITGDNGSGKSTLINHLMAHLKISPDRLVYLPQEMSMAVSRDILSQVRQLSNEAQGHVFTIVNRLFHAGKVETEATW